MKKHLFTITLTFMVLAISVGCNTTGEPTVEEMISGKTWLGKRVIDLSDIENGTEIYSVTGYYEQGFKLKETGEYIPKYSESKNTDPKGSWSISEDEQYLIILTDQGVRYEYAIVKMNRKFLLTGSAEGYYYFE